MFKKTVSCLAVGSLLALGGGAVAEMCTIDDVPAATLLLPYFEVDLDDVNGVNTLFSVNNASAASAIAHVTIWTDMSVPVLDFDVYLTGYDVQTMSMRNIVNGILPVTADDGADLANDSISPQGNLPPPPLVQPQDNNRAGNTGPCNSISYPNQLSADFVQGHLQPALTGTLSNRVNCVGAPYGDNIARGYVTVDLVNQCNLDFPSTPGYFASVAEFDNILWGDYFYTNQVENFAQGETLVHIEACEPGDGYIGFVGNGAGQCPFAPGDFTFYSRYVADDGSDQREGLSSQFATRYLRGGDFDGGTDLVIWRDSRSTDLVGGSCPANRTTIFSWYPLNQNVVIAFDEEEQSEELCVTSSDVSPPDDDQPTCFPLETGKYNVENSIVPGSSSLDPTPEFGWLFLDLDLSPFQPSQAWVTPVMSAQGRFSVGFDAIQLDSVCTEQFLIPGLAAE